MRYIKSTQHLECNGEKKCNLLTEYKCKEHMEESTVVGQYLGAVPVIRQTGIVLWEALNKLVSEEWGLDWKNCRGFSS